jgi:RNA polymerase sigma factor (sigma-70 family)
MTGGLMQQQEPVMLTDLSCDALYQRYASGIFAYFYKQTASRDDAEDLLLDVFLAAMERNNLTDLKEAEQKAWLWSVARNKVADYYRRQARHPGVKLHQVEETLYIDEAQEPEQVTLRREEYANLRATSVQDCSRKKTLANTDYQAAGSPDGKKIATASYDTGTLEIEDSDGNTIKRITFAQLGVQNLPEMIWSSDSKKLIFIADDTNHVEFIKSIDANGGNLKTLVSVDGRKGARGFLELSPGGKYAFASDFNFTKHQKEYSIWDVNSGKKVSDISSDNGKSGFGSLAFSPDSSLLAMGGNNQISIFSTANGKLMKTIDYKEAEDTAWSPDGKYLAVCSTSISIYDVKTKQAIMTFGKVADPANQKVIDVAWSPDGTGLVSSLDQPDDGKSQTPASIWALS